MRKRFLTLMVLFFSSLGFCLIEGVSEREVPLWSELKWGLQGHGLGAISSVDYSEEYSRGFGWGVGLEIQKDFTPIVQGIFGIGYQVMNLGRVISGSGIIQDPGSEFSQSQSGFFTRGLLRYFFPGAFLENREFRNFSWEFGGEYFHTLRALQTHSSGVTQTLTASKFLFFETGPTVHWDAGKGTVLAISPHFLVNLVGESAFKLMGVRLGLAINLVL